MPTTNVASTEASPTLIPLAVAGAAGRMGKRLVALALGQQPGRFQLVAALDRADCPLLGQECAGRLPGCRKRA